MPAVPEVLREIESFFELSWLAASADVARRVGCSSGTGEAAMFALVTDRRGRLTSAEGLEMVGLRWSGVLRSVERANRDRGLSLVCGRLSEAGRAVGLGLDLRVTAVAVGAGCGSEGRATVVVCRLASWDFLGTLGSRGVALFNRAVEVDDCGDDETVRSEAGARWGLELDVTSIFRLASEGRVSAFWGSFESVSRWGWVAT